METVGDPRLDHNLVKQSPHWKTTYIPRALHGDAVPVIKVGKTGTNSFEVTSISPLMAIGRTKAIKQLVLLGCLKSAKWQQARAMVRTSTSFVMITTPHGTFGGLCCGRCILHFLEYGQRVMQMAMRSVLIQWRVKRGGKPLAWLVPCHTCPQR